MRLRGFNDFNYINLLKGFYDENTHSRIIAEFLNPRGTHYQGSIFLEKFFEQFGLNYDHEPLKWEVYTESPVEDCIEKGRGRIDILLKNDNKYIVIENKIGAGDQEAQIYKYIKCLDKNSSEDDILVIYLTKYDHDPSSYSLDNCIIVNDDTILEKNTGKRLAKYRRVHYNDILRWMESNLSEVENISNLREAIKQYIKALKHILDKEEDAMNLKDYLLRDENKDQLIHLIENYEEFKEYSQEDEKCKIIVESEKLDNTIYEIKKFIRSECSKKIKEYLQESNYSVINGHEAFGNYAKMSYLLFTKDDLQNGYILFFENQDIKNLKLGTINCNDCDSNDIAYIRKSCEKNYCWDTIKTKKCFKLTHISSFDSLDFYINYLKNDLDAVNAIIERIYGLLS